MSERPLKILAAPSEPGRFRGQLNRGHADGLEAFGSLLDLELDTLVFLERPKAAAADLGEVDEDILGPIVRSDKTEALVTVEPLHSSLHHYLLLSFRADVQKIRAHSNRIDDGQRIIRAQHGAALQQEQRGPELINGALSAAVTAVTMRRPRRAARGAARSSRGTRARRAPPGRTVCPRGPSA